MKTSLRIFGIILVALSTISMSECPDREDARVGTYTLTSAEVEVGGRSGTLYPPDIRGTLTLSSDGRFSMRISSTSVSRSGSGTWNSTTLTLDSGDDLHYSFDENNNTIEFTFNVDGITSTYVWQKI